jgi:glycosyltransferase involved in cell wall biosynthesis
MRPRERLRVALFTYGVQPRGGVVHALSLAEALVELGHEAVLFALDDTGRGLFRSARCPVVLVPVAKVANESILPFVRRRIAAYVDAFEIADMAGFDVYHAHDGIGGNALATLTERGAIDGFVRTVHHLDDFADPELAALQERSVRAAERCYVVSALWQRRLEERFGVASDIVPNGVDLARFFPIGVPERAGIEQRKNALGTLDAFAHVRTWRPDARLAVAGGASVFDHGTYRHAYETRVAELGLRLGKDVVVLGALPDADIVRLLHAADALVFPSFMEGFGLVLLEALACGTPAVTSNAAPFTEFLGPEDALFADPHDPAAIAAAMLHALDPLVANALRTRGPLVAARHTWAASAVVHADRYRDLVVAKEMFHARNAIRGALAG